MINLNNKIETNKNYIQCDTIILVLNFKEILPILVLQLNVQRIQVKSLTFKNLKMYNRPTKKIIYTE